MSLSRLPQVALRRLMPAITAVPKSLDDDQLKKILEPHNQTPMTKLPSKTDLSTLSSPQGLASMLSKLPTSDTKMSPALGRLLLNLSGTQGKLSSQDLALLKAADQDSESSTPGSPSMLLTAESSAGALDPASVDALTSALRDTTTECPDSPTSALLEHNELASDHSDNELAPISNSLSAAERRREQNRRAQKKFRQKDKVRQKEVKWRAAQYDNLVESNKRFKKDIDEISRERDMYRRILELNGIDIDQEMKIGHTDKITTGSVTLENLRDTVAPASKRAGSAASLTSSNTVNNSPLMATPGMDQIAQDTFGQISGDLVTPHAVSMQDLISSLMFGGNVVQQIPMVGDVDKDPMFGSVTPSPASTLMPVSSASSGLWFDSASSSSSSSSANGAAAVNGSSTDPLLVESPLIIDQHQMDAQFGAQHTMADSHMVDPMAFIDELLASPSFSSSTMMSSETRVRKRSFDDTL
ncbi:hypothetical protein GGF40_001988 [Coemansia sp. RSA 1286]|nr:hypothetical protein IWW45_004761 [Coemansia sp. RSA 485]KAJ2637965.1 hypothetical protein GGF40_001988 [Coemansia sp. RSA 1286]